MTLRTKNSTFSKLALAGVLAALVIPTAAFANDTLGKQNASAAPIQVASCLQNATLIQQPNLGDIHVVADSAQVTFVNRENVAATDIVFRLRNGDDTRVVHDRGTFAPGTAIDHSFAMRAGGSYLAQTATCSVVSAHFANSTAWSSDGRAAVGAK